MIVRITFKDKNDSSFTMLFGSSYKDWDTQVAEYINHQIRWWDFETLMKCEIFAIESVEISACEWMGWGGLKWCSHEGFQEELNREGCQDKEADNPNPRKYSDMRFDYSEKAFKIVYSIFKKRMRHLYGKEKAEILNLIPENNEKKS